MHSIVLPDLLCAANAHYSFSVFADIGNSAYAFLLPRNQPSRGCVGDLLALVEQLLSSYA